MLLVKETEKQIIEFLDKKDFQKTNDDVLNNAMRAAEAHRRIRYNVQQMIKPGKSLKEIIKYVEDSTRIMLKGEKNNGIGFPCGISLNDCAAHFSLNPWNDDILLGENDVLKIDYGTHSDGRIIDSAFTVCFDEKFENLLKASQEATNAAIKFVGIDTKVCDIGKVVSEVMASFEISDAYNNFKPIKPVENLNGHSIGQFKIHDGVHIPSVNNGDKTRITEGFIAIETFSTTGNGYVKEDGDCSHYMVTSNKVSLDRIYNQKSKDIYKIVNKEIGTLPFSPNFISHYSPGVKQFSFKLLAARNFIEAYPPLFDTPKNSHIAQFEHTLYLKETSKKIVSEGIDY